MTAQPPPLWGNRTWSRRVLALVLGSGVLALAVVLGCTWFLARPSASRPLTPPPVPRLDSLNLPRQLAGGKHFTVWRDVLPADLQRRTLPSGEKSNIHPSDYVGPQACQQCHPQNYATWTQHSHRWMNALADATTVKGDFTAAALSYRGGQATFSRQGDQYRMRLERGNLRRTYAITQTIGSRFFQYYVGKQIEGPESDSHPFARKDHVLPFGYWLEQQEWVPIVHVGPETEDAERLDPYTPPDHGNYFAVYASSCNYCHTTFPLADLFGRRPDLVGEHAPVQLHWSMQPYLEAAHPDVLRAVAAQSAETAVQNPMAEWEAPQHAVTLGVSCEACHLGARTHVESGGQVRPRFFPASPHLAVEAKPADLEGGRTHANVNWACGRCHTGNRPQFAAGMSTWNSVEYSDAMRGSCYSQLRCIDCHNPHRTIGPKWSASADQDDAVCLKCHKQFQPAAQRQSHTHHPAGSAGARCLNCHMPRLNEGLQEVVRTHMIYAPTRADMIEANQPNACNLCHTEQPIDWTLRTLKEWYGKTYDEAALTAHYPDRTRPALVGWLKSDNPAVRLVAADALTRAGDVKALPQLLDALDDPYLINRQFASRGLQELLHVRLTDFGYRFYQTSAERRQPLANVRARFAPTQ